MQARPENKTDFPPYKGNRKFHKFIDHYSYDTGERVFVHHEGESGYHRNFAKTYVKVWVEGTIWTKPRWDYGYILVTPYVAGTPDHLIRTAMVLDRYNHKFRRSPVRGTSKWGNWVNAKRRNGFRTEAGYNHECSHEYPELHLTRAKRKKVVDLANDWDFYDRNHNRQRGWKRSKKRKQWMK